MVAAVKKALFQEPRPGKMSDWLWFVMAGGGILLGCVCMIDGLFFSDFSMVGGPSYSLLWFLFGLMGTLRFAAELLPKGWSFPAGLLRAGAISTGVVGLLLVPIL